ncbi:hypothetical protein C1646_764288 [Rhizophagus diaphanus]|nr:hypothetical protein C1646_764288 [Rhizophagus diaphanus] [Rhizophagus sp. MUCL 43196]
MQSIEYQEFKDSNALIGFPNLATQLFSNIDQVIKTYLTSELLSLQRTQMNQATLYYCKELPLDELYNVKHQEADEFGIDFVENYSESRQMELDTLILQCEKDLIASIWKVKHYNSIKINYIVLLSNRTYMCSYMYLITMGLYCQHFFQVMLHTTESFFHIKLIPIRWFKDKYLQMEPNIVAANEPFITAQGDCIMENNFVANGIVFQIHGDLNDEERVKAKARRIRDLYGKISGIFKEVLKKTMDYEDFSLYNTINQWIVNKQLAQQREDEGLFQFHSNDNLNHTEDILPPEFKRYKGAILRDTYED